MGARKSILKHRLSWNRPYILVGSIVVAGHPWITEPLIKAFSGYSGNFNRSFSGRYTFTIDGKEVDVNVNNRSMQDLSQFLDTHVRFRPRNVGLLLTYDVTDEDSFEAVKQAAISPHPEMKASKMPIVLVGFHCQQKEKREVSYYATREFADERGIPVVEVSENTGVHTELAIMTLVGEMLSKNTFERMEILFDDVVVV